jgi:hypothetical protein
MSPGRTWTSWQRRTKTPRKAADTLERYNPPGSVKDAIEHFVTAGGAHFDDPDYTKNNKVLDKLGQAGLPDLIGQVVTVWGG